MNGPEVRPLPPGPARGVPHRPAGARRAWGWAAAVAVLLGAVFLLYAEPDFVVMMADQMWACF